MAVVGTIALPWYIAVGLRTQGSFLATFLGTHNVGRFVRPMEGHSGPIFYYLVAIAIGFFPWSCFLGSMFVGWWRRLASGGGARLACTFVACWAAAYVGFFSLAGTKLPSYVLPAYPALALIVGCFLEGMLAGRFEARRYWAPVSFACLALVGLGMTAGAVVVAARMLPGEFGLAAIGLAPLAAGLACLWLLRRERLTAALATFAAAAVVLAVGVLGWGAARVDRHQPSRPLIARLREHSSPGRKLAAYGILEPSWVYYAGQPIRELANAGDLADFLKASGEAYVITTATAVEQLPLGLPPGTAVLGRVPRFLREEEIVVVGRATELARWTDGADTARSAVRQGSSAGFH
jgi:4-amino-4-deoxy-L-arabinose transferase-like glycosyltransferase